VVGGLEVMTDQSDDEIRNGHRHNLCTHAVTVMIQGPPSSLFSLLSPDLLKFRSVVDD
jgi:hypothetical protein